MLREGSSGILGTAESEHGTGPMVGGLGAEGEATWMGQQLCDLGHDSHPLLVLNSPVGGHLPHGVSTSEYKADVLSLVSNQCSVHMRTHTSQTLFTVH